MLLQRCCKIGSARAAALVRVAAAVATQQRWGEVGAASKRRRRRTTRRRRRRGGAKRMTCRTVQQVSNRSRQHVANRQCSKKQRRPYALFMTLRWKRSQASGSPNKTCTQVLVWSSTGARCSAKARLQPRSWPATLGFSSASPAVVAGQCQDFRDIVVKLNAAEKLLQPLVIQKNSQEAACSDHCNGTCRLWEARSALACWLLLMVPLAGVLRKATNVPPALCMRYTAVMADAELQLKNFKTMVQQAKRLLPKAASKRSAA